MMQTMERPERYDPEDIEHLMLERPFEELLAEEKAFVLRHLQDGAEYERMRALLLHMQVESGRQPPLEADPAVREHVLTAFREHRQPQWRIWLNSVGAFLLPARPVHYWRPALALGAVAVVTITSITLWNAMHPQGNKVLAEVQQPKAPPAQPELRPSGESTGAAHVQPPAETAAPVLQEETTVQENLDLEQAQVEQRAAAPTPSPATAGDQAAGGAITTMAADMDQPPPPPPVASTDDLTPREDMARTMRNVAAAKTEAAAERLPPPHTEDQLLGLLRAAW